MLKYYIYAINKYGSKIMLQSSPHSVLKLPCWTRPCVMCLNSVLHPFSLQAVQLRLRSVGRASKWVSHHTGKSHYRSLKFAQYRGPEYRRWNNPTLLHANISFFSLSLKNTWFKYLINLKFKFCKNNFIRMY